MKKLFNPLPNLPVLVSGLKRRMSQLAPYRVDSPFEESESPFDQYYQNKLLKSLNLQEVFGCSVLEVGCGVGDLLKAAAVHQPSEIYGVDEEEEALNLAKKHLDDVDCDLSIAALSDLPFPAQSFDYVFALFEMQYLKSENLQSAVDEVCRVCRQWVILVEETSLEEEEEDGVYFRPLHFYKNAFHKAGFHLRQTKYLDVAFSRTVYRSKRSPMLWLRWVFSPLLFLIGFPASWMKFPTGKGEEEVPSNKFALWLQKMTLPLTSGLDDIFTAGKGIAIMRFERERLFRRG